MSPALRPAAWLACAGLISALALAFVHVLQAQGYIPCELCLRQREVYWTALAVAVAAFLAGRWRPIIWRVGLVAVGVAFLVGAGVAAYHAGVEWKWWAGPTACTGGNAGAGVGASQVADLFSGRSKVHMVRCDEAAIRVLGLSLSGWNALASLALALISFGVLATTGRTRSPL